MVILLDGMDEVADKTLRERIARLIEQFTVRYPKPRYVVTSRIVGYEAAAFFAVAQFRDVTLGQILYGGDDVSGEAVWDQRDWHRLFDVRERLFWLAAEACLTLG